MKREILSKNKTFQSDSPFVCKKIENKKLKIKEKCWKNAAVAADCWKRYKKKVKKNKTKN